MLTAQVIAYSWDWVLSYESIDRVYDKAGNCLRPETVIDTKAVASPAKVGANGAFFTFLKKYALFRVPTKSRQNRDGTYAGHAHANSLGVGPSR